MGGLSLYHFSFLKILALAGPFPSPASCMSSIISFPKRTPVVYFMLLGFFNFWQNSVLSCQNTKKYISFKSLQLVISVIAAQAKTSFCFFFLLNTCIFLFGEPVLPKSGVSYKLPCEIILLLVYTK